MEEEKETKQLLARGEIRTMQKDIARLLEGESQKERGKIAQLKTEEEIKKEWERRERAKKEAELRGKAALEARIGEKGIEALREKREEMKEAMDLEESAKQKFKTKEFQERFQKIQTEEETEREKFLERMKEETPAPPAPAPVAPVSPIPIPPPPSPLSRPIRAEEFTEPLSYELPQKPSFTDKIWIRIVVGLLAVAILAGLGTFWYWYFVAREKPIKKAEQIEEKTTEKIVQEVVVPPALISTEASTTLEIANWQEITNVLSPILNQYLGENKFTRVIIKDSASNKIVGLQDFLTAFQAIAPSAFFNKTKDDFTLFIYSNKGVNRLGWVSEIIGADLTSLVGSWEPVMANNLDGLLVFLGKSGPAPVNYFQGAPYLDVVFRYLSMPPANFGICWATVDNYFIFTTSGESMIKTINKIRFK